MLFRRERDGIKRRVPEPKKVYVETEASERVEAQVLFTAIMTDTLIEEGPEEAEREGVEAEREGVEAEQETAYEEPEPDGYVNETPIYRVGKEKEAADEQSNA